MVRMQDLWTEDVDDMFNQLTAAEVARDEALAIVAQNSGEWFPRALARLKAIPVGTEGIFEYFRLLLRAGGLEEPPSQNAWGSLARTAISYKILEPTGRREKMKTVRSHARMSDVLRRI